MKYINPIFRLFVIFLNSWLLAFQPTALALAAADQAQVKKFVEASGLSKGPQSFQDFYNHVAPMLPPEVAQEFAVLLKNKNLKLPKVNVTKVVGENGESNVQIQFTEGKNSYSMIVKGRPDAFLQIGAMNFSKHDLSQPQVLAGKIKKAVPVPSDQISQYYTATNYGILDSDDLKKLTDSERKEYFRKLQQILVLLEQRDLQHLKVNSKSPQEKTKNSQWLMELLVQTANATDAEDMVWNSKAVSQIQVGKTSCIYAGRIADYGYKISNGEQFREKIDKKPGHYACGGPGSKFWETRNADWSCKTSGNKPGIKCNPAVFGDNLCVPQHLNTATEKCYSDSTKYSSFPKKTFKSEKEFDELREGVLAKIKAEESLCQEISGEKGKSRLRDQQKTCEQLNIRINEIRALTCKVAKDEEKFKGSQCEALKPEGQAAGETPAVATGSPPITAGPGTAENVDCPTHLAQPKADKSACQSPGGTVVPDPKGCWTCNCSENFKAIVKDRLVIGCEAKSGVSSSGSTANGAGSTKKPSGGNSGGGFFSSLSGYWPQILFGVIAIGVMYYGMNRQIDKQMEVWTPKPTATPVPAATATPSVRGSR